MDRRPRTGLAPRYVGPTQRKEVSLSSMVAFAAFLSDGAARSNGEVKADLCSSYRPGFASMEHHSQVFPHRSNTPYGLTPAWYRATGVVLPIPASATLHFAAVGSSPHG